MEFSSALIGLSTHEADLITRAGAHAAAEATLAPYARFTNDVTDLDAARLIHLLERGALVVPHVRAYVMFRGRTPMPHLTRTVIECLRLGLAVQETLPTAPDIYRTQIRPAKMHLRAGAVNQPRCHDTAALRYRTLDDLDLVDCAACLRMHQ